MKVELFVYKPRKFKTETLMYDALHVMSSVYNLYGHYKGMAVNKTEENEVMDWNLNGIEIGSYGMRTLSNGNDIIFGTGLAEPRFSVAMSK